MKHFVNVKDISEYLVLNGIKPSFQRVKIFERLNEKKDHPTVNDIYSELVKDIPSLSKTTVYNTLNIFIEKGVAKAIGTESNESRYDLVTHSHGHFICDECGKIYDIDIDTDINLGFLEKEGHKISSIELNIKGVCKDCLKK